MKSSEPEDCDGDPMIQTFTVLDAVNIGKNCDIIAWSRHKSS